jgi:hypothetical protein
MRWFCDQEACDGSVVPAASIPKRRATSYSNADLDFTVAIEHDCPSLLLS